MIPERQERRPVRPETGPRAGRRLIPALAGALLASVAAGPLRAADGAEAQGESVRGVGTFESDPIGIELDRLIHLPFDLERGYDPDAERGWLNTFIVFPQLETDLVYTSNLYRTSTAEKADVLTIYRPVLEIRSDWDNHQLSLRGQLDEGRYFSNPSEDYTDYSLTATLLLNVDDFTTTTTRLSHGRSHGLRGDIDDPGSQFEPTIQYQNTFEQRAAHNVPEGIQFEPSFKISEIWVRDNGPIDNSDRARTDYDLQARIGWEVEPGTVVFVQPRVLWSRYDMRFDAFGTQRDLNQYELTAGVRLDPSPIVFLEFLGGLTQRNFADPNLEDGTGTLARGQFIWNPSTLWTVTGSLDQSFSPASVAGVSGTLSHTGRLGLDWSPHDAVVLGANFTYNTQEFLGTTPERTRERYIFGLDGQWAINRSWYTSGSVTHEIQFGDLAVDELTEDRLQVRLGVKL